MCCVVKLKEAGNDLDRATRGQKAVVREPWTPKIGWALRGLGEMLALEARAVSD